MHQASLSTPADLHRKDAQAACTQGAEAQARQDLPSARRWFERARRLLPSDPAVAFALAGILLQTRETGAAALLVDALKHAEAGELWLSLVAAHLHDGDVAAARRALGRLLSGHVLSVAPATIAALAQRALAGADPGGWCAVVRAPGGGKLSLIAGCADVRVRVDGEEISGRVLPEAGKAVVVTHRGRALLGSPIDLAALRRVEGFVEASASGLTGWAWHPADAAEDPWLIVRSIPSGESLRVRATNSTVPALRPMSRPRGFALSRAALAHLPPPLAISAIDGTPLTGSPVDPDRMLRAATRVAREVAACFPATGLATVPNDLLNLAAPAAVLGLSAQAPACPGRPVAIVIPAYRDEARTRDCLESVFATAPADTRIIVVDDATPEPGLAAMLEGLADAGRIRLIRHSANQGFPASANAGLRAAFALSPAHDALLLNNDTLLPLGASSWLDRLRRAVHSAPDIGTATPLSNDGGILSYPARDAANPMPDRRALRQRDGQALRANAGVVVDIPTGVGFCLYIRRECAEGVGLFRTDLFAQGYGEENDLCIRARHLGWRHVAVPGVYVGHAGGTSFGDARPKLARRNLDVLEQLHPGYLALIAEYQAQIPAQDALAPARRRIDALRWAARRRPGAVILLSHASGGGVEQVLRGRISDIARAGQRAIVLRPVPNPECDGDAMAFLCRMSDGAAEADFPNLVFDLRHDLPALVRLLGGDRPTEFEVHHRLGHDASVMSVAEALGLPVSFHLHDYASFCPRVTLFGAGETYCGEPVDIAACEACVADAGGRTGESIGVAALRQRSEAEFGAARRIVVPSADMASRMRRHFPTLRPEIVPHEAKMPPPPPLANAATPRRIAVIGALGVEKGYNVLLACARDAAARDLPLQFVLVGHSVDDTRLFETGRVVVTGRYGEADGEALLRAQNASLAFLPSIVPETWGFTLSLAWRAGLRAAVFDLGAMAARVRQSGWGVALPLGLPPRAINQVLLKTVGRPAA
jgi:GT2 family glycosyltransferase